MILINSLRRRVVVSHYRRQFNRIASGILSTPPLRPGNLPFLTLSMVHHRDVLAYLVAIKSFAYYVASKRIVVVCDPTITQEDRACLKKNVPHIELRDAAEFRHPALPVGGTWERLYAISHYVKESYVIQLDADTVCTAPLEEVIISIEQRRGFVLGEEEDQRVLSLGEATVNAMAWSDRHIQAVAEKSMSKVMHPDHRYIRGCSGFTGFPISNALNSTLIDFSLRMSEYLGERWSEWGTEQVASNYLVANCPEVAILPFPKYSTPPPDFTDVAFHHYIGHIRFIDARYVHAARAALRKLAG